MEPLSIPVYRRSWREWGPRNLRDAGVGVLLAFVICLLFLVLWTFLASIGTLLAYWFGICARPTLLHNWCGLSAGTLVGAGALAALLLLLLAIYWFAIALAKLCQTDDRL